MGDRVDFADMPEKLAQMREMFAIEAARNCVLPIGGGLWVPIFHPELRITPPYREWDFPGAITRMPEFCAPKLGNTDNTVTIHAELPADANGVLYALGGAAGGLTCYLDDGFLCYEYNLFIISRTKIRSSAKLQAGRPRSSSKPAMPNRGRPDRSTSPCKPEATSSRRAACRSAHRCCSPPTTASISASASVRLCRWTTTTGHRSPSTAKLSASTSPTRKRLRRHFRPGIFITVRTIGISDFCHSAAGTPGGGSRLNTRALAIV